MNFILESEVLEAQAQYDFSARSSREVSFKKGDTILLYAQVPPPPPPSHGKILKLHSPTLSSICKIRCISIQGPGSDKLSLSPLTASDGNYTPL